MGVQSSHPALEALLQRESGKRFGKRIAFDHSEFDDLRGTLQQQIEERAVAREIHEKEFIESEQENIKKAHSKVIKEIEERAKDQEAKRKAILEANEKLVQRNLERDMKIKAEEAKNKVDYFPFTHGDLIETQRKTLVSL